MSVSACGLAFSGNTASSQTNQPGSNDNNQYGAFPSNGISIIQQPVSGTAVYAGSAVITSVVTIGTVTGYQWYKDGPGGVSTAVPNQTRARLNLTNVQTSDAGSYSLVVTGTCHSLTSNAFSLTVNVPPAMRLYVNASAGGANTGLSWTDAFTDLQSALNYTNSQNLTQIWVAGGTYKPTSTTDRLSSFVINKNVSLYGGFVGTETSLSQRAPINPAAGPGGAAQPSSTTLSGDIGTAGDNGDNTYQLVRYVGGVPSAAVLDGFVLYAANSRNISQMEYFAFVSTGYHVYGAAVGIYNNSNPTMRNCSFLLNRALVHGGAVYSDQNGTANISNCVFQNNGNPSTSTVTTDGGATSIRNAVLTNCLFVANYADNGGAIKIPPQGGNTITKCTFVNNSARYGGDR